MKKIQEKKDEENAGKINKMLENEIWRKCKRRKMRKLQDGETARDEKKKKSFSNQLH